MPVCLEIRCCKGSPTATSDFPPRLQTSISTLHRQSIYLEPFQASNNLFNMRSFAILPALLFIGSVFAFPTEMGELEKRGNGCYSIFHTDDGVCKFHCVNDVTKKCSNGKVLRPTGGKCGGIASAFCQCIYSSNC
ncbi:hypothetical protein BCR34DRAFT_611048 [Clohesyomyces aquaticus]|uniref:Uncharacterized protein n=1 Tax=Clohesyomyces aquaticus TaxID=1231657 RepID=A0A1Y2A472_9PLEO|nr:hypothetical protein BCR34DRAFT_611048 [Clohesyomyces aquaticus]